MMLLEIRSLTLLSTSIIFLNGYALISYPKAFSSLITNRIFGLNKISNYFPNAMQSFYTQHPPSSSLSGEPSSSLMNHIRNSSNLASRINELKRTIPDSNENSKPMLNYSFYSSTYTNVDSSDIDNEVDDHHRDDSEFHKKIKDIAEPLLDLQLVAKTIEQWSRPLPSHYLMSPLVLVGPSAVGKGRLVSALLADYSKFFKKVVTHTTRNPRPDELLRQSYFFVSNHSFHEMVNNASFLEWAKVHNNFYGTTMEAFKQVQNEKKISILEIDIQGARSIKAISKQMAIRPKYIFVKPPNVDLLKERLLVRGTESPQEMALRLHNAEAEISQADEQGFFDAIIVNEDLEKTTNQFFRLMRDWYPALPSAARIRMLQRKAKQIKALFKNNSNDTKQQSEDGDIYVTNDKSSNIS